MIGYPRELDNGALHGMPVEEVALLGAAMIDSSTLDRCADLVDAADFENRQLARLWVHAQRLHADGVGVDFVSLAGAMESDGTGVSIDLLMALADAKGTSVNIEWSARVVRRAADCRRARAACLAAAEALADVSPYDENHTADALRQVALSVDRACHRAGTGEDRAAVLTDELRKFLAQTHQRFKDFRAGNPQRVTISTGFAALDDLLGGGMQMKGIYTIAAKEKGGKTAYATQLIEGAAKADLSALVLQHEVPNDHSAGRLIAAAAGVKNAAMLTGCLSDQDIDRMVAGVRTISEWADRVHLRYCPGTGVDYVEREVRRFVRSTAHQKAPLGLIVLDHIHCLVPEPGSRYATKDEFMREVVLRLAALAAETNAVMLVLSQQNRADSQRADRRPKTSDLRDSAALVEKSWGLIQLYRPGADPTTGAPPYEAALYVTANRYGPTGHVPVHFDGARQRFSLPAACWDNSR